MRKIDEIDAYGKTVGYVEDQLFGDPRMKDERVPDAELPCDDAFDGAGLRGYWTVHFDYDEQALQPDDDWKTVTRADIRYVILDSHDQHRPHRFYPRELTETTMSYLQQICDEYCEGIGK